MLLTLKSRVVVALLGSFLSLPPVSGVPVSAPHSYTDLIDLSTLASLQKRDQHFTKAITTDFADPSVFQDYNQWYAFASNNHKVVAVAGGRQINVQVARSSDFKAWNLLGNDALPTLPAWADAQNPKVWAPNVIVNDQKQYVLYFSAATARDSSKHCIGVAVASTPAGPYQPLPNPLACPTAQGGGIDASGFRDADGSLWVVYKIDGNAIGHGGVCGNTVAPQVPTPIMLQRVTSDGHTPIGNPIQILDRSNLDGPLVEAPALMRTSGGEYVLFFSSNCYSSSNYDIAYAFANNIRGPYTKRGPMARTGTSGLYAPGGAHVAHDGVHMVLHAGNAGPANGWRAMYIASISVDVRNQVVNS